MVLYKKHNKVSLVGWGVHSGAKYLARKKYENTTKCFKIIKKNNILKQCVEVYSHTCMNYIPASSRSSIFASCAVSATSRI